METSREHLESTLNDFAPEKRRAALAALCEAAKAGEIALPEPGQAVNLHCHTFFSFNGYGYSPSYIAWKARCMGLRAVGCIDFDVLDAVDEFLDAGDAVGIKACAGLETRIYIPSFGDREMNSPGEPGVAYFVGAGFTSSDAGNSPLLPQLKTMAQDRTRGIMERVNAYLDPVRLDFDADVLPLTPKGNATERHLCAAYETKAIACLPDTDARAAFWAAKLGSDDEAVRALFDDSPGFQGLIRSKTMKSGGVGYVKPEGSEFPSLETVCAFILERGAIPAYAWLDGLTPGEQDIENLLDTAAAEGAAMLNIIPDRNWNIADPELKKAKVEQLHNIVALAQSRDLPIIAGTEMNAYGQKFVDDFDVPEMAPVAQAFLDGAHIVYAHTVLQRAAGMGYLSPWAIQHFATTVDKNAFYRDFGERWTPGRKAGFSAEDSPEGLLAIA